MENLTETTDYKNFDPHWYIEHYFATEEASVNMRSDMDVLYRFFNECAIYGKSLLDIGTGPTVHTVITASNHVDEIYLSDYAQQNIEYLEKWHKGEISHPVKLVEYVISLEGRKMTAAEREAEVRAKVKRILPVDVTSENPLGRDVDKSNFDVIITSCCIEAAIHTVDGYTQCLKNISSLLNKGGYLIISGDLEGENYQVGKYKYPGLSITKEEVQESLKKAGYDVKVFVEIPGSSEDAQHSDCNSYYFVLAQK